MIDIVVNNDTRHIFYVFLRFKMYLLLDTILEIHCDGILN